MYWNYPLDLEFIETTGVALPVEDVELLESLFRAANELCMAYAPALPDGALLPDRYKLAEIMQAAHLWTQFRGGNRESFDSEGFVPASYPLVFSARDLLRPKRSPLSRLG